MVSKSKNDSPVTCHLSSDYAEAVKNFAFSADMTPSQWMRNLVEREINNKRLQAQATLKALGNLANESNESNESSGEY